MAVGELDRPPLLGAHPVRCDRWDRFTVPVPARPALAQGVVVTRGQDRCLYVYPASTFERLGQRLADLPLADRAGRSLVRILCSAAERQWPDQRNRIRLSPRLRAYAGLTGPECLLVGVNTRFEIWAPDSWARAAQRLEERGGGSQAPVAAKPPST